MSETFFACHAPDDVWIDVSFSFWDQVTACKSFSKLQGHEVEVHEGNEAYEGHEVNESLKGEISQAPLQASRGGPGPVDGGRLRTPRRCHAHPVWQILACQDQAGARAGGGALRTLPLPYQKSIRAWWKPLEPPSFLLTPLVLFEARWSTLVSR